MSDQNKSLTSEAMTVGAAIGRHNTRHMPTSSRRRKIEDPLWEPFRLYAYGAMSGLSYFANIPWTFWILLIPGLFIARLVLRRSAGHRSGSSK